MSSLVCKSKPDHHIISHQEKKKYILKQISLAQSG